jgi:cysteine desulfurase
VLRAMGLSPEASHGSIRFGLSRDTTENEIDSAVRIVVEVVTRLRESLAAV